MFTQRYDKMLLKIKKIIFVAFWPCCCSLDHYNGAQDMYLYEKFSWGFFMFDSILSEILWIDKLHYFHEKIYFPNNGYYGNSKKAISQL